MIGGTLRDLLAEALKEEFSFMGGTDESWQKAAGGILAKIEAKSIVPDEDHKLFTQAQAELLDKALWAMGWDYRKQSRLDFLMSYTYEATECLAENQRHHRDFARLRSAINEWEGISKQRTVENADMHEVLKQLRNILG